MLRIKHKQTVKNSYPHLAYALDSQEDKQVNVCKTVMGAKEEIGIQEMVYKMLKGRCEIE